MGSMMERAVLAAKQGKVRDRCDEQPSKQHLHDLADKLRGEMLPPQARLWVHLRDGFCGEKFLAEVPMRGWILDFYCEALKLAIEVDGKHHRLNKLRRDKDRIRDRTLYNEEGIYTLRLTARFVLFHINQALLKIERAIIERPPRDEVLKVRSEKRQRRKRKKRQRITKVQRCYSCAAPVSPTDIVVIGGRDIKWCGRYPCLKRMKGLAKAKKR